MVEINRVVGFLVLALIIYFIVTEPRTAAGFVQSLGGTLRDAADSVTLFFKEIV